MCEPLTIAAVSAMAVGGGLKAYSEYTAGQAEAAVADANVQLAERNRADALELGATQAGEVREKGTQVAGQQKVALASSGVDVSTGSAVNLFADTAGKAELDAQTAKSNAAKRAWGFELEAETQRARASMARRRSYLGPLGTLAGTGGQIAAYKA